MQVRRKERKCRAGDERIKYKIKRDIFRGDIGFLPVFALSSALQCLLATLEVSPRHREFIHEKADPLSKTFIQSCLLSVLPPPTALLLKSSPFFFI